MTESDQTLTTAEPQLDEIRQYGCDKKFNGRDGEYGKSASLWLADMERCREVGSSPSTYLQHIDRHLVGEAAKWVLDTPRVMSLIYGAYRGLATESDVDSLHEALRNHFKLTLQEAREFEDEKPLERFMNEPQGDSDLQQYYGRALDLLLALNGRDGENDTLTLPEISLRAIVVRVFVAGLSSERLKTWLRQQHICHHTVSLHRAFTMADAASSKVDSMNEATASGKEQAVGGHQASEMAHAATEVIDLTTEAKASKGPRTRQTKRRPSTDATHPRAQKKSKVVTLKLPATSGISHRSSRSRPAAKLLAL